MRWEETRSLTFLIPPLLVEGVRRDLDEETLQPAAMCMKGFVIAWAMSSY